MRHLVLLGILLVSLLVFAADNPASCKITEGSALSHSSSGVPQFSNLELIQITCSVPARPWPSNLTPGHARYPVKAKTTAYQVSADGTKTLVPSWAHWTGGSGCGPPGIVGDCTEESTFFYLNIPIDPAEAMAQLREFSKQLEAERSTSEEDRQHIEERMRDLESHPEELAEVVPQYRVGRFHVECRVMDGDRVLGVGHVDLEILFKGRALDGLLRKK